MKRMMFEVGDPKIEQEATVKDFEFWFSKIDQVPAVSDFEFEFLNFELAVKEPDISSLAVIDFEPPRTFFEMWTFFDGDVGRTETMTSSELVYLKSPEKCEVYLAPGSGMNLADLFK